MAFTKKPTPPECVASILDVPFDAGRSMGGVEALHECKGSGEFVHSIVRAAVDAHGTAGPEWVRWVVGHIDELPERIGMEVERWKTAHVPKSAQDEIQNAASRFSLVAAAGELATAAGITGWNQGEAFTSVGRCFDSWRKFHGQTLFTTTSAR